MRKQLYLSQISVILWCLTLPTISRADLILSIDLDSSSIGIQNSRSVLVGQSFQASLILELTGGTSLDSYRSSVSFDSAGIAFNSALSTALPNYTPQALAPSLVGNVVAPFEAAADTIGNGSAAPFGPFAIGTFSFTALNGIGSFSITPFEDVTDGSFDNNLDPIAPVYRGATLTVNAIPEPASGLLLLLASTAIAFRRRCRRSHRRESAFKRSELQP